MCEERCGKLEADRKLEADKKFEASKTFVHNIQTRARDNAFAHRYAGNEAKRLNDRWTTVNLLATSLTLLFTPLALVYVTEHKEVVALTFTVSSLIASFVSLFTQTILLHKKFDVTETTHQYFQGSFQYISQRAREIQRPGYGHDQVDELIDDLDRDFALLKARAIEPQDRHFRAATDLRNEIRTNPKYAGARSFAPLEPQPDLDESESSTESAKNSGDEPRPRWWQIWKRWFGRKFQED